MDSDPRFSKFGTDPKFRPVPKRDRKVKVDPRFRSMFEDPKFVHKVSVDKRGRPRNFATKENFQKFYDLESSSSEEEEEEEEDNVKSDKTKKTQKKKEVVKKSDKKKGKNGTKKEVDVEKKILQKLRTDEVDYARGEGRLLSDSSSDDSSSDEVESEIEEAEPFDKWGELDQDAERTDESTKRLAVCNMDWDRVGAQDLFIALSSFCPPGGTVHSVKIFLSEFGKQRLEEENTLGPPELRQSSNKKESLEDLDDDGEPDAETMEKIRIYQVNRLKYYYAVAQFDSIKSADTVYKECDGMEYELSATRFDLRFIPDDMTFDDEAPNETCDKMPHPDTYKPKVFETTALKQGKVNLTWDETDPDRQAALRKAFEVSSDEENDVKAYLANSSDDDSETGEAKEFGDDQEESENDEAVVSKYKALLTEIKGKEKKVKEEAADMEVSWIPSDVVNEEAKQKEFDSLTPWEQYLQKKKDKRKEKKERSKGKKEKGDDQPFSDDDLPEGIDLDDPFFKTTSTDPEVTEKKSDKKKNKNKNKKKEETKEDKGLSLLLMDSDDEKDHFDYKDIVKSETKKKRKKNKNQNKKESGDDFKLNLSDNRFAAIFDKAEYNVDPSNPNFKKTKSMQALIEEKQRRRKDKTANVQVEQEPAKKKSRMEQKSTSTLDNLVHAVQAKSKRMKMDKKFKN